MLIAHAPTGMLMTAMLIKLKPQAVSWPRWYLMGAVMGLLPDLDMLWFYFCRTQTIPSPRVCAALAYCLAEHQCVGSGVVLD